MRIGRIALSGIMLSALASAQVEPGEERSIVEIFLDNPPLLISVIAITVLVLMVLYYLFPMKKAMKKKGA